MSRAPATADLGAALRWLLPTGAPHHHSVVAHSTMPRRARLLLKCAKTAPAFKTLARSGCIGHNDRLTISSHRPDQGRCTRKVLPCPLGKPRSMDGLIGEPTWQRWQAPDLALRGCSGSDDRVGESRERFPAGAGERYRRRCHDDLDLEVAMAPLASDQDAALRV